MKNIANFLVKVLVKQFYLINAGFFLFAFLFFFGIVKNGQLIYYHRSLIEAMITSPIFMLVVWLGWLFYNFKCISFCIRTIKAADSNYLYTLKALSFSRQFLLYLFVSKLQYLPVLIYSCFVVYLAISKSMLVTALSVAACQLLMIAVSAIILYRTINKHNNISSFDKLLSSLSSFYKVRTGYVAFLLAHIFHEKKMALLVVKIFSILLLSVSFVRNGDDFDRDLFSIFFQLILAGHAVLVFYVVSFSESQLQFGRNLPLPLFKTAVLYLFTFSILLLPEAAFMLVNNHGNLPMSYIFLQYLTAVVILFLYTGILYGCGLDMEGYMLFVFIAFLMIFFLQKTGQLLLTMLGILLTAVSIFKSHYYSFEKQ